MAAHILVLLHFGDAMLCPVRWKMLLLFRRGSLEAARPTGSGRQSDFQRSGSLRGFASRNRDKTRM